MRLTVLSSKFTPDAVLVFLINFSAVYARTATSEADEAQITDPVEEFTSYYYAPVTDALDGFPTIWQPATIVSNDTEAQNIWANISQSVPTNIFPHGDIYGDWNDTTLCTTPKLSTLPSDVASIPEVSFLIQWTMFFIGSNVLDWPYEAMRAIDEGHEICALTGFSSEDAFAELYYKTCLQMKAIKLVLGVTPTCWRPPFGDVDDRIRAIAEGLGLQTIIWQYDSFDWEEQSGNITAAQVYTNYDNFIARAENGTFNTEGSIMLTHELNNFTMQTADTFKYLVPVGVALNKTQSYVETNYSLPTFDEYISGNVTTNSSSSSSSNSTSSSTSQSSSAGVRLIQTISSVLLASITLGILMLAALGMRERAFEMRSLVNEKLLDAILERAMNGLQLWPWHLKELAAE
ncbi:putative chitin deacetylase [Lentinula aff. detonsa]|uniref:chitin deacetylase n=1 Tax=Lentinula aff. detonsa TaxID=2804958 RepID=A0AA38L2M5_9AGAR|nr:putative chitin deacetylase [Lentinula aff. detonsa]KAJ3792745.1 putative chitin deacetylase [Lentinula aff. detonsa]